MASYRGCFLIEEFVIEVHHWAVVWQEKVFQPHQFFLENILEQMRTMRNQRISEQNLASLVELEAMG